MDEKDPRNLRLNLAKKAGQSNPRNLNLNFGNSSESKDVSAFFITEISAPVLDIDADTLQTGDALAHIAIQILQPVLEFDIISTALPPEYVGIYAEVGAPILSMDTSYDFNVLRNVVSERIAHYEQSNRLTKTSSALHQASQPFKSHTSLQYQFVDRADGIGGDTYQDVKQLKDVNRLIWQDTDALEKHQSDIYQSNELRRKSNHQAWQETEKQTVIASDNYDYNIETRRSSSSWWQQAIQKGITCGFGFNASVWLQVMERLRFQQTKKPNTGAWIEPPIPEPGRPPYVGSGHLNFCCKKASVNPLDVVLNFTDERCDPAPPEHLDNKKVYFIMNEGYLKRVSDGVAIEMKSLNLSIDRDSWCWSFSASLPFTEEEKVNSDDEYIEVELGLNGFVWRLLIESNTSNQQFASTDIQIKGRSTTAMLAEEAGTRSYNQDIAASSVQLAQAELQRITLDSPFSLEWSLIDQIGWSVPAHAWSYMDLTPIKAIQEIAEGAGGFVTSHMKDRKLLIQPRYAYAPWEWVGLIPEVSIPFNLVLQRTREKDFKPEYNAVTVSAENQGIQAVVKREGTAGDKMAPPAVTAFINSEQPARTMARAELSKYGKKRMYQDTIPLHPDVGVILPSKIIGMQDKDLSTWNGHSYGTSISANWNGDAGLKIRQTFTVERYIA